VVSGVMGEGWGDASTRPPSNIPSLHSSPLPSPRTPHSHPSLSYQPHNFARLRMPAELRLLEDWRAVDRHLESPTAAGREGDEGAGVLFTNRGRQTGGPGFVVSDDAELDGDLHAWTLVGSQRKVISASARSLRRKSPAQVEERRDEQHGTRRKRPGHDHERDSRCDAVPYGQVRGHQIRELGECPSPQDE